MSEPGETTFCFSVLFWSFPPKTPPHLGIEIHTRGCHDNTVTCASAACAPMVEDLFDTTLQDWSQKRNVGKTERLLVVPNAPRVQVGMSEVGCSEARPRVKVVRHVGGLLSADGRHDHDTSYRVSRARRMVGVIARVLGQGVKKIGVAVLLLLASLCVCES